MTHRERLDAIITRAIRQRWANDPKRAAYEERRYLARVEQHRAKLPTSSLSAPAARHLRFMAQHGTGTPHAMQRRNWPPVEPSNER